MGFWLAVTNWDREKAIAVTGLDSFVTRSIVSRAGCCIGHSIGVDGEQPPQNLPSLPLAQFLHLHRGVLWVRTSVSLPGDSREPREM